MKNLVLLISSVLFIAIVLTFGLNLTTHISGFSSLIGEDKVGMAYLNDVLGENANNSNNFLIQKINDTLTNISINISNSPNISNKLSETNNGNNIQENNPIIKDNITSDNNIISLNNELGILETTPPYVGFDKSMDKSGSAKNKTFIYVNVTISDTGSGIKNMTIYLYNSSNKLVKNYSYFYNSNNLIYRTNLGHRVYALASSSNGINVSAGDYQGYIYTSSDGGITWVQRTSSGSRSWHAIASSSNGVKLVAVALGEYIYTSSDGGATWTSRTSAGIHSWWSVSSSLDGTKLAAVSTDGYIFTSSDSGATWTQRYYDSTFQWRAIDSSDDGTKLVAGYTTGSGGNGYIYTSSNSGNTWTKRSSAGNRPWISVSSSSDGTKLLAGSANGYIYSSSNSGVSWTELTSAGYKEDWYVVSSSDGVKIAAAPYLFSAGGDYIYTSSDSGVNWEHLNSNLDLWVSVTFSSIGDHLVAGSFSGSIYSIQDYYPYYNFTNLKDGIYYFNATAYDKDGNFNHTETRNVTIDTHYPLINIISPNASNYSSQVLINISVSDLTPVHVWWSNGTNNFTYNGEIVKTFSKGKHTIRVWANDSVGHINQTNITFNVSFSEKLLINVSSRIVTQKDDYYDNEIVNITSYSSELIAFDSIPIKNCPELLSISNDLSGSYYLTRDINCSGNTFIPFGTKSTPFTGILNGRRHTISGIKIYNITKNYAGLFGVTKNAQLYNIILKEENITAKNSVGGLVGFANNTLIYGCKVEGNIIGNYSVGGIAGEAWNTKIKNSASKVNVLASYKIAGGIVGIMQGIINMSLTNSQIFSGSIAGGLIGKSNRTLVENSYSKGSVLTLDSSGGIAGVGVINITNSYSSMALSRYSNIGGLVGEYYGGIIKNSFAIGNISAISKKYTGALIGKNTSAQNTIIINSYWYNSSYMKCIGNKTSACDANLIKTLSYFSDKTNSPMDEWDFNNIWMQKSLPELRIAKEEQSYILSNKNISVCVNLSIQYYNTTYSIWKDEWKLLGGHKINLTANVSFDLSRLWNNYSLVNEFNTNFRHAYPSGFGKYRAKVIAMDKTCNEQYTNATYNFSITQILNKIKLISPKDGYTTIFTSINFSCNATNAGLDNISLLIWQGHSIPTVYTKDYNGKTKYNWSITLPRGTYQWTCKAYNTLGEVSYAKENRSFIIGNIQVQIKTIKEKYTDNQWVNLTDPPVQSTSEGVISKGTGVNNNLWNSIKSNKIFNNMINYFGQDVITMSSSGQYCFGAYGGCSAIIQSSCSDYTDELSCASDGSCGWNQYICQDGIDCSSKGYMMLGYFGLACPPLADQALCDSTVYYRSQNSVIPCHYGTINGMTGCFDGDTACSLSTIGSTPYLPCQGTDVGINSMTCDQIEIPLNQDPDQYCFSYYSSIGSYGSGGNYQCGFTGYGSTCSSAYQCGDISILSTPTPTPVSCGDYVSQPDCDANPNCRWNDFSLSPVCETFCNVAYNNQQDCELDYLCMWISDPSMGTPHCNNACFACPSGGGTFTPYGEYSGPSTCAWGGICGLEQVCSVNNGETSWLVENAGGVQGLFCDTCYMVNGDFLCGYVYDNGGNLGITDCISSNENPTCDCYGIASGLTPSCLTTTTTIPMLPTPTPSASSCCDGITLDSFGNPIISGASCNILCSKACLFDTLTQSYYDYDCYSGSWSQGVTCNGPFDYNGICLGGVTTTIPMLPSPTPISSSTTTSMLPSPTPTPSSTTTTSILPFPTPTSTTSSTLMGRCYYTTCAFDYYDYYNWKGPDGWHSDPAGWYLDGCDYLDDPSCVHNDGDQVCSYQGSDGCNRGVIIYHKYDTSSARDADYARVQREYYLSGGVNCPVLPQCESSTTTTTLLSSVCGNGILEQGEQCEIGQTKTYICPYTGQTKTVTCNPDCTWYIPQPCVPSSTCGNGIVETGEQCEIGDRSGIACEPPQVGSVERVCNQWCTWNYIDNCQDIEPSPTPGNNMCYFKNCYYSDPLNENYYSKINWNLDFEKNIDLYLPRHGDCVSSEACMGYYNRYYSYASRSKTTRDNYNCPNPYLNYPCIYIMSTPTPGITPTPYIPPNYLLNKIDWKDPVIGGDFINYTIILLEKSGQTINLAIRDLFDENTTYVNAKPTPSYKDLPHRDLRWPIQLSPHQKKYINLTVKSETSGVNYRTHNNATEINFGQRDIEATLVLESDKTTPVENQSFIISTVNTTACVNLSVEYFNGVTWVYDWNVTTKYLINLTENKKVGLDTIWNNLSRTRGFNTDNRSLYPNGIGKYRAVVVAYYDDCKTPIASDSYEFNISSLCQELSVINVTSPKNINYHDTNLININFTAYHPLGIKKLWWNNGTNNIIYTGPVQIEVSEGKHNFTFYANNSCGFVTSKSVIFKVGNESIYFSNITYPRGLYELAGLYSLPVTRNKFNITFSNLTADIGEKFECRIIKTDNSVLTLQKILIAPINNGRLTLNYTLKASPLDPTGAYERTWYVDNCTVYSSLGKVLYQNLSDSPIYVKTEKWYFNVNSIRNSIDAANAFLSKPLSGIQSQRMYFGHNDTANNDLIFAGHKMIESQKFEGICNDGVDNDNDGLIDCNDLDCQTVFEPNCGHRISIGGVGQFSVQEDKVSISDVPLGTCQNNICRYLHDAVEVKYTQKADPNGYVKVTYYNSGGVQNKQVILRLGNLTNLHLSDARSSLYGPVQLPYKQLIGTPAQVLMATSKLDASDQGIYSGSTINFGMNQSLNNQETGIYRLPLSVYISADKLTSTITINVSTNTPYNLFENDTKLPHDHSKFIQGIQTTVNESCNDGIDNDLNFDNTDCRDSDCNNIQIGVTSHSQPIRCEYGNEKTCWDGFDNDGDGYVDCADSDCQGRIGAFYNSTGLPVKWNTSSTEKAYCENNNINGAGGQNYEGTFFYSNLISSCNDKFDNDANNQAWGSGILCDGTYSNCRFKKIDCFDYYSCWGRSGTFSSTGDICPKREDQCNDGIDNDYDVDIQTYSDNNWLHLRIPDPNYDSTGADCDDYDCYGLKNVGDQIICSASTSRITEYNGDATTCWDGKDNDLDGHYWDGSGYAQNLSTGIDCDDPDCLGVVNPSDPTQICLAKEFNLGVIDLCWDNQDNDYDNKALGGGSTSYSCADNQLNKFDAVNVATNFADLTNTDCWGRYQVCKPCPSIENITYDSCADEIDNDYDNGNRNYEISLSGKDCSDLDCNGEFGTYYGARCISENNALTCSDEFDNDADGNIDCADSSCNGIITSKGICKTSESVSADCNDDFDNDRDNLLDCIDNGCWGVGVCHAKDWTSTGLTTVPSLTGFMNTHNNNAEYLYTNRVHINENNFSIRIRNKVDTNGKAVMIALGHSGDIIGFNVNSNDIKINSGTDIFTKTWTDNILTLDQISGDGSFDVNITIPVPSGTSLGTETFQLTTLIDTMGIAQISTTVYEAGKPTISKIEIEPSSEPTIINMWDYLNIRAIPTDLTTGGSGIYSCNFKMDSGTTSIQTDCINEYLFTSEETHTIYVNATDQYNNIGPITSKTFTVNIKPKETTSNYKLERAFYDSTHTLLDIGDFIFVTGYGDNFVGSCNIILENDSQILDREILALGSGTSFNEWCSGIINLPTDIKLKDGMYYVRVNVTDSDGDSVLSKRKIFYVCNNLESHGEGWTCAKADLDNDGFTEGLNSTTFGLLYGGASMSCDSCPGILNLGMDSDGDGIDDACDGFTLNVYSPQNKIYNISQILINFSATHELGIDRMWYKNATGIVDYTDPRNEILNDGSYSFIFYANNSLSARTSKQVDFMVDTTPPDITIIAPIVGNVVGWDVSLIASITDLGSGLLDADYKIVNKTGYVLKTGIISSGLLNDVWNTDQTIADGNYTLIINARDNVNNRAKKNVTLSLDNSAPSIQFIDPNMGNRYKTNPFNLDIRISNHNLKNISYKILNKNNQVIQAETWILPIGVMNYKIDNLTKEIIQGNYSVVVYADDYTNNKKTESSWYYRYNPMVINLITPVDQMAYSINLLNYNWQVLSLNNKTDCKVYIDSNLVNDSQIDNTLKGNGTHFVSHNLLSGLHNWTVSCNNTFGETRDSNVNKFSILCEEGKTLCQDGTCKVDCSDGSKDCIVQNGICDLGEGCKCSDCNGSQDNCWINSVCENENFLCVIPRIGLVSPLNNSIINSSNNVILRYNFSNYIANVNNCSLYINNNYIETNKNIASQTGLWFTENLANGNYNWSIECYYNSGYLVSSESWNFSVNVITFNPPHSGSSSRGGSSGGYAPSVITQETSFVDNQARILATPPYVYRFEVNQNWYGLSIDLIDENKITFRIPPFETKFTQEKGTTQYYDLNYDGIDDIAIKLNDIIGDKADIKLNILAEPEPLVEQPVLIKLVEKETPTPIIPEVSVAQPVKSYLIPILIFIAVLILAISFVTYTWLRKEDKNEIEFEKVNPAILEKQINKKLTKGETGRQIENEILAEKVPKTIIEKELKRKGLINGKIKNIINNLLTKPKRLTLEEKHELKKKAQVEKLKQEKLALLNQKLALKSNITSIKKSKTKEESPLKQNTIIKPSLIVKEKPILKETLSVKPKVITPEIPVLKNNLVRQEKPYEKERTFIQSKLNEKSSLAKAREIISNEVHNFTDIEQKQKSEISKDKKKKWSNKTIEEEIEKINQDIKRLKGG